MKRFIGKLNKNVKIPSETVGSTLHEYGAPLADAVKDKILEGRKNNMKNNVILNIFFNPSHQRQ